MSNCNTSECCFHGIDLVVKCYDPLSDFNEFKVPTWWFNRCNGKLFILKGIVDGKAIWQEISEMGESGIQEILTQCGSVTPNENGEIIHTGECGARIVAADCTDLCITVNTEWGLTGGKTVCAGESITLGIDNENTNLVTSSSSDVQDGDSVVFDGTSGKKIKKADGLLVVSTNNSEKNSGIEIVSTDGTGFPYINLKHGNQNWNIRSNPTNNALEFRPVNDLSKASMLTLFPNGNCVRPFQTKATAYFTKTPTFTPNQPYTIGSNQKITIIRDNDGYNLSANYFFPGDGAGNGAYYITPYNGRFYEVSYQFLVDRGGQTQNPETFYVQVVYGDYIIYNRGRIAAGASYQTVHLSGNLPESVAGKKIEFKVIVQGGTPYINSFVTFPSLDNYIQIYMKD
jgi:hypothetical protein